jgi:hypothetical protein
LAECVSHRQACHLDRLASSCISPILALEIKTGRQTASVTGGQAIDPSNGSGESDLGEEQIADELLLKLHIRLSPRTVGKYLNQPPWPGGSKDQRWSTFLHNHAHGIVACDFFFSVTTHFRILYVFVALEIGSRRIVHFQRDRASYG